MDWKAEQLQNSLIQLGLREGSDVMAHVSMRAVGTCENGASTLVEALQKTIGPEGTILVPTFHWTHADPASRRTPPETPAELEAERKAVLPYRAANEASSPRVMGVFSEQVRLHPEALRSKHPGYSFAAVGPHAKTYTSRVPFNFPLGSSSSLDHLHRQNGQVLLIGTHYPTNVALYLAEIWANVPYIHRSTRYKMSNGRWRQMQGCPGCSRGFGKIETLLRQSRILKEGMIGDAPAQLMNVRQMISMAMAMLEGNGAALLCIDEDCRFCTVARRMTAAPEVGKATS